MVSKLTAAVIFVGATLFGFPVHAEQSDTPPPQATATSAASTKEQETPARLGLRLSEVESADVDRLNLKYLKAGVIDTGRIISSPLYWEKKQWLKLGAVVGGTGALFLVDRKINNLAKDNQNSVASKVGDFGNFIGTPQYIFPSVGAFYLYGHLADDSKARRASLLALESMTISGVLTMGMKLIAQRHRPNSTDDPFRFDGPSSAFDHVSFSSGHTAFSFSAATVIAEEYKDNAYVPPVAYGLATLTGLARIYSNEHWSSDVFFGAALGYLVSKTVLSYHKKNDEGENRLTIMPSIGEQMTGLSLRYDF